MPPTNSGQPRPHSPHPLPTPRSRSRPRSRPEAAAAETGAGGSARCRAVHHGYANEAHANEARAREMAPLSAPRPGPTFVLHLQVRRAQHGQQGLQQRGGRLSHQLLWGQGQGEGAAGTLRAPGWLRAAP